MKNVLITGSGRSGTSMLAGLFGKANYYFGDHLYEPRGANPKGFFEDEDINNINEDIIITGLVNNGVSDETAQRLRRQYEGHMWLFNASSEWMFKANRSEKGRIKSLVSRSPYCFKDPRFCYTLENWLGVTKDTITLCVYRDPAVTVDSIMRECRTEQYLYSTNIGVEAAFEIWNNIYLRLLKLYAQFENIYFINYEDILSGEVINDLEVLIGAELDHGFPEKKYNRSKPNYKINYKTDLIYGLIRELTGLGFDKATRAEHLDAIQAIQDRINSGSKWLADMSTRPPSVEKIFDIVTSDLYREKQDEVDVAKSETSLMSQRLKIIEKELKNVKNRQSITIEKNKDKVKELISRYKGRESKIIEKSKKKEEEVIGKYRERENEITEKSKEREKGIIDKYKESENEIIGKYKEREKVIIENYKEREIEVIKDYENREFELKSIHKHKLDELAVLTTNLQDELLASREETKKERIRFNDLRDKMNKGVEKSEAEIRQLSEKILRVEAELNVLNLRNSYNEKIINDYATSRSWRLTLPLRKTGNILRKFKLLFKYLKRSIFNNDSDAQYRICRAIYRLIPLPVLVKSRLKDKLINAEYFNTTSAPEVHVVKVSPAKLDAKDHVHKREESQSRSAGKEYPNVFCGHENRVLVVEMRIPTPDKTSGSTRLYAMLKLITEIGHPVTFISYNSKDQYHWVFDDNSEFKPHERNLAEMGVNVIYGMQNGIVHLEEHGYRYSQVMLSYPDVAYKFLPFVRAHAVNAEVIFDTVDLHGLRFRREAELKKDQALLERADYYDKIEKICIDNSDKVIAITENEKHKILQISPNAHVEIVPNIHITNQSLTPFSKRSGLLFIGHYLHSPNQDAVIYFVNTVLPLIHKKLPGIKFTMLGSSITDEVKNLACEYVDAVGYVEDPEPYFSSHRVFVSPLRYGAGMKGKIGQSLSMGLPLVTTTIGAEGMGIENNKQALIADDDVEFANAVVSLYTNEKLWNSIAKNGIEHIEDHYSFNAVRDSINKIFPSREIERRGAA